MSRDDYPFQMVEKFGIAAFCGFEVTCEDADPPPKHLTWDELKEIHGNTNWVNITWPSRQTTSIHAAAVLETSYLCRIVTKTAAAFLKPTGSRLSQFTLTERSHFCACGLTCWKLWKDHDYTDFSSPELQGCFGASHWCHRLIVLWFTEIHIQIWFHGLRSEH